MKVRFLKPDRGLHVGWFPMPEVTQVCIPGAPEALQGLNALFISDVHLRRQVSDEKLNDLIALLRAQNADLILLGGDYAEQADQCRRFFDAFRGLRARLGCFGVMGNNDREAFPDASEMQRIAAQAGVHLLVNESVILPGGIEIGGCDDHKRGKPETKELFKSEEYRILLSHFPVKPDCEADLMLSGHTHGGQFNLLGITPYLIGFEHRYRMEAVSGLHRLGRRQLLVSKGIGVSRLPLRIGVNPQVLLVNFTG